AAVRDRLRGLLISWTGTATTLLSGHWTDNRGLATGLGPAGLVATVGLGASALSKAGLEAALPEALAPLPDFPGAALDPARSDGDLGLQVCAEDPVVVFAA